MTSAKDLFRAAEPLGACSRLRGTENPEELMRLFLTPQGIEFCQKNNFPDLPTLRTFRGPLAVQCGIFIDAGCIELHNAPLVALVGDTQATLLYDDPSKRHQVVLMHGARADIEASGFAVVFVTRGEGCEVIAETNDMAKVL